LVQNAGEVLSESRIDQVVDTVLGVDKVDDFGAVMRLLAPHSAND